MGLGLRLGIQIWSHYLVFWARKINKNIKVLNPQHFRPRPELAVFSVVSSIRKRQSVKWQLTSFNFYGKEHIRALLAVIKELSHSILNVCFNDIIRNCGPKAHGILSFTLYTITYDHNQ